MHTEPSAKFEEFKPIRLGGKNRLFFVIDDVIANILKRVSGPRGKILCSQLPLLLVSLTVYSDLSGIELAARRHYGNSSNSDFLPGSIAAFFCPLQVFKQPNSYWDVRPERLEQVRRSQQR